MTDTAYFIAGISVLLAVIFFVIRRIDRNSYLHTPVQFPKPWAKQEEPMPAIRSSAKMLQSGETAQGTVEWFTSRNPAGRKQRESDREAAQATPYRPEKREDVFVGVAIVEEKPEEEAPAKPKSNVERWYRQAINE